MTTRVKICGMTDRADLATAVDAGADAVGLISDVPVETPREIAPERARALADAVPPFVTSVLVTMPENVDALEALVGTIEPDVVQLHGELPADDLADARESIPVIRALDVDEGDVIRRAADHADAVLIDSTDEQGAGGTGDTHDWTRTRAYVEELDVPVILAGGLTPANVRDAVAQVRPYAVDVASGVEGPEGKDADVVAEFVSKAKEAI